MVSSKYYKVVRVTQDAAELTPLYIENISGEDGVFYTVVNPEICQRRIMYKVDGGEWTNYPDNGPRIDVPNGSRIYLKSDAMEFSDSDNNNTLRLARKSNDTEYIDFNIGGYLTSLIRANNFDEVTCIPGSAFQNLFNNQRVISAKNLITDNIQFVDRRSFAYCFYNTPITELPDGMFENVISTDDESFLNCFFNCASLETLPTGMFTNVKIAGFNAFSSCFQSCNILANLPDGMFGKVTNVSNSAFESCFNSCDGLKVLPNGLFKSVEGGYQGVFNSCFANCASLTTLPDDLFESVVFGGYRFFENCFANCYSLTALPCGLFKNVGAIGGESTFSWCFQGCSSLIVGPDFRNVQCENSVYGFYGCFSGCSSIRLIYAPAVPVWNETIFGEWVGGVPSTGKMYVKDGVEIPRNGNGAPEDWQLITY